MLTRTSTIVLHDIHLDTATDMASPNGATTGATTRSTSRWQGSRGSSTFDPQNRERPLPKRFPFDGYAPTGSTPWRGNPLHPGPGQHRPRGWALHRSSSRPSISRRVTTSPASFASCFAAMAMAGRGTRPAGCSASSKACAASQEFGWKGQLMMILTVSSQTDNPTTMRFPHRRGSVPRGICECGLPQQQPRGHTGRNRPRAVAFTSDAHAAGL